MYNLPLTTWLTCRTTGELSCDEMIRMSLVCVFTFARDLVLPRFLCYECVYDDVSTKYVWKFVLYVCYVLSDPTRKHLIQY